MSELRPALLDKGSGVDEGEGTAFGSDADSVAKAATEIGLPLAVHPVEGLVSVRSSRGLLGTYRQKSSAEVHIRYAKT
ncbi:hypothetical protein PV387_22590 [Streptomyces sp. ME02-6987-2C]|uniref:hypothetical protein n=1 Tax=Streptomyces sp. ME02-6987-2C TaxID=3028676 RepID=UPI0029A8B3A7|nr:hypothetical protein [Streptomyces sp. ME02-6987-2C]MDX3368792.1 hypothetical protein [Streptomyces sp. ME02-6987-2C]